MDMQIYFPHLHIFLENVGKTFTVFGYDIAYYGVTLTTALFSGYLMAAHEAKRTGQKPDDYLDLFFLIVVVSLICARAYYVIFSWDYYKENLWEIINFRQGGLAIYGGILGAVVAVYFFGKRKKIPFWKLCDTACLGLTLGQIIGRWGNFFNREAFGEYTNNIFAMQLPVSAVRANEITEMMKSHIQTIQGIQFIQVHPTFLYEGLWNCGLLLFLLWYRNRKKFQGELFLMDILGYALGRVWIERLRTDQLRVPHTAMPVSQLLAGILAVVSFTAIIVKRYKMTAEDKIVKMDESKTDKS